MENENNKLNKSNKHETLTSMECSLTPMYVAYKQLVIRKHREQVIVF